MVRVDALSKARGETKYTDDLPFDGLYGAVVRSEIANGEILSVKLDENFDFSDFVIADYRDIEGSDINSLVCDDQPFLAEKRVRFVGEPIILIAHRDRNRLFEAKRHIEIEYREMEAVLTPQEALDKRSIVHGEDNIYRRITLTHGEIPDGRRELKRVKKVYTTSAQEHLYLEPQSMLARYEDGDIHIIGSMQCPFSVSQALEIASGGRKIPVEQAPGVGGGFGGKEDYPSLMAVWAYILCKKARKDVKIIFDRKEDLLYTTKRHPSTTTYETLFDDRGKIHSMSVDILLDGGAYCTLSTVVLSRAILHACGFYDIPHIRLNGSVVATNKPPFGAFRGFGAPQVIFALERHMDDIAYRLGISPAEVRRVNLPTSKSRTSTGVPVTLHEEIRNIFEQALSTSGYEEKRRSLPKGRGIGLALFMHGGGYTGNGEIMLSSRVRLRLSGGGIVTIEVASVEMGQGSMTALMKMVAKRLNIPMDRIRYTIPNTSIVADSGPTVASRTVMIVGTLLEKASDSISRAIGEYDDSSSFEKAVDRYLETGGREIFEEVYRKSDDIVWDEEYYRGYGYDDYSLACYVAEVEVDSVDFTVNIESFVAVNDIGRVVDMKMAQGQVEGGVAQGIGYALSERVIFDSDGRVSLSGISDYIVPLADDIPDIDVHFVESCAKAKGLGELPMDGTASAVVNAIVDAIGVEIDCIPALPEKIMEASC